MTISELPFIIKNKYFDEYIKLVAENTTDCGYTETHHIICKCFFKYLNLPIDNSKTNLVRLLFKDHCKAHWLLYKCTTGPMKEAMANAFISMLGFKNFRDRLDIGLSELDYQDLQDKINKLKAELDNNFWSTDDLTFLVQNYSEHGQRYCADHLNRSIKSIALKASELGLQIARYFSEDELTFLRTNFCKLGAAECAARLGRSVACISTKASRLGLTTSTNYTEAEKAFLIANYEKFGPTWCSRQLNKPYENIKAYAAHVLHIKTRPQGTPIYCPELNRTFSSIKAAAIELNMSDGVICQVVNKKQKAIHGLTFEKIDKEKYYEERTHTN